MTTTAVLSQNQEFAFSDAEFRRIADLAKQEFGLNLPDSKKPLVYSRLTKRLRLRNIASFDAYIELLDSRSDAEEKTALLSALTTNVTQFFREAHHFELLRIEILPDLVARARAGERVRIWSAGCSTGQEPFSIAMTLLDVLPDAAKHDIKVLATDIDPVVLRRAQSGVYPLDELEGIPQALRAKWTHEIGDESKTFAMKQETHALITFAALNLIDNWPVKGPFDVIFCRNVAIYFDQETQHTLWSSFGSVLAKDGTLMIGHSERIPDSLSGQFRSIGVTAYRHLGVNKSENRRVTS